MPQSPPATRYANVRRSPRFGFDALVKLLVPQLDQLQELWCRSTDLCQDGIGLNLIAGDLKQDGAVSLQIPLPAQAAVGLRASLRYRIGRRCGFAFLDLDEGQQSAIRKACETLARSQSRMNTSAFRERLPASQAAVAAPLLSGASDLWQDFILRWAAWSVRRR